MSWMNTWSRPSKHAATPPPLYLLPGGEVTLYCHSCGRVIGSRKIQTSKSSNDTVKYCSERCRHRKPNETDRNIEDTFVVLLKGADPVTDTKDEITDILPSQKKTNASIKKKVKGESRITVLCGEVEEAVFGPRHDPEKVFGRKENRAKRGVPETSEWKSVDMEDGAQVYDDYSNDHSGGENGDGEEQEYPATFCAGKPRSAQKTSEVNFSVGGERGWAEKIEETEELRQKRLEGQRRAEEREAVRCAARRLCAFGVAVVGEDEGGASTRLKKMGKGGPEPERLKHPQRMKKCEAVLKDGTVVEASFAKGEWGIRWRE
jgi:hypothetical protein